MLFPQWLSLMESGEKQSVADCKTDRADERARILPAAGRMSAVRRQFSRPAKYSKMILISPDGLSAAIPQADGIIEDQS